MFSRTPRRLRLRTGAVALIALVVAVTIVGQFTHSSSRALAAQNTAYRVSLANGPQQAIAAAERNVQSQARQQQAAAAQAKVAQLSQYIAAVESARLGNFLRALGAAAQQHEAATAVPVSQPVAAPVAASSDDAGGWAAVAECEEGGADDPNYGYYGIKEWNGFDGYPTAGSAPQSVQLQWEQENVGSPPDESGGCHSY
jgi:hypothetical protein